MFANFDRKPVQYYHYNPIGENEIEGTQSNFSPFSVSMSEEQMEKKSSRTRMYAVAVVTLGIMSVITFLQFSQVANPIVQQEFDPVSDVTTPYSTVDPRLLGFPIADRYGNSVPGSIFGDLVNDSTPLPTNAWCQNLLLSDPYNSQANQAFQVPYLVDTAGYIPVSCRTILPVSSVNISSR